MADEPIKIVVESPDELIREARRVFKMVKSYLDDLGVPEFVGYWPAALAGAAILIISTVVSLGLAVFVWVAPKFAGPILQIIGKARKELDPQVAQVAAEVLNEFLGTDYGPADIPTGTDFKSHVERARVIGGRFQQVMLDEFVGAGGISPEQGRAAAARFSGFVINFSVATALLAIISEIETLGQIEQVRELGVEVARNLGLGRLHRLALRPLFNITVSKPLTDDLNRRYRPTDFKEPDIVKLLHAGQIDEATAHEALARLGYADDKIQALFELLTSRLTATDLERLIRWGLWERKDAVDQLTKQGYDKQMADFAILSVELARADVRVRTYVAEVEKQYVDGVVDAEQHLALIQNLALTEREIGIERRIAGTKKELPRKFLTIAQLNKALAEGVIDVTEYTEETVREGYSADDQKILRILALLNTAAKEEAAKQKAAKTAATAAKRVAAGQSPTGVDRRATPRKKTTPKPPAGTPPGA